MTNKKTLSSLLVITLVFGFLFVAMPEKGNAGVMPPPDGFFGCCQYANESETEFSCISSPGRCPLSVELEFVGFFEESSCNRDTGLCDAFRPEPAQVPTLSEWGLIATAGVLGIVSFMVIRRRKATA